MNKHVKAPTKTKRDDEIGYLLGREREQVFDREAIKCLDELAPRVDAVADEVSWAYSATIVEIALRVIAYAGVGDPTSGQSGTVSDAVWVARLGAHLKVLLRDLRAARDSHEPELEDLRHRREVVAAVKKWF